jgi:hypothetical protein
MCEDTSEADSLFIEAGGNRSSPTTVTKCHTRILGVQNPGANIITRCAGTKSHTYDEIMAQDRMSHLYYITGVLYKINK